MSGETVYSNVPDPTPNVLNVMDDAITRQDDLREAERRFNVAEIFHLRESLKHVHETANLRAENTREVRAAEAGRIDANRATDIAAVAAANAVSVQQANTLAAQVSTSADAQRSSLANALEPIQKDISEIRKTQYEAAGGKLQQTEAKISIGQIVAIISLVAFLTFGMISSLGVLLGAVIYFRG